MYEARDAKREEKYLHYATFDECTSSSSCSFATFFSLSSLVLQTLVRHLPPTYENKKGSQRQPWPAARYKRAADGLCLWRNFYRAVYWLNIEIRFIEWAGKLITTHIKCAHGDLLGGVIKVSRNNICCGGWKLVIPWHQQISPVNYRKRFLYRIRKWSTEMYFGRRTSVWIKHLLVYFCGIVLGRMVPDEFMTHHD